MSSTIEPLDTSTLLARIKSRLHAVYGDRLRGVVLYGSEARGEATPDSDVDILVLLTGPVALGRPARYSAADCSCLSATTRPSRGCKEPSGWSASPKMLRTDSDLKRAATG